VTNVTGFVTVEGGGRFPLLATRRSCHHTEEAVEENDHIWSIEEFDAYDLFAEYVDGEQLMNIDDDLAKLLP